MEASKGLSDFWLGRFRALGFGLKVGDGGMDD